MDLPESRRGDIFAKYSRKLPPRRNLQRVRAQLDHHNRHRLQGSTVCLTGELTGLHETPASLRLVANTIHEGLSEIPGTEIDDVVAATASFIARHVGTRH